MTAENDAITPLNIKLLAIGDELLSGRTQDVTTAWLGTFLQQHALKLRQVTIQADQISGLEKEIKESWSNFDITILSGGLGITRDDITKKALAVAFSKAISFNQETLQLVNENYTRMGKTYKYENKGNELEDQGLYPHIPEDFTSISNPAGLAPGLLYEKKNKMIVALPGVPHEFQQMFEQHIFPHIKEKFLKDNNFHEYLVFRTRHVPEEKIFTQLCPHLWNQLESIGQVASLPHILGVDIVVSLYAQSQNAIDNLKEKGLTIVNESPLKEYVWQIGNKSLEKWIIDKALEKGLTIGTGESCTGGLISHYLTNIPGSSSVYLGGVVSYAYEVKENVLNVNRDTLRTHGAVSVETVEEMARGVREIIGCDIAIATSGIAGPAGETPDKPVGTVCFGISTKEKTIGFRHQYRGDRLKLKETFRMKALYLLLDAINSH